MLITPKSEEQLTIDRLWPDGEYDFTVVEAKDTISRSSKDMIQLTLKVINDAAQSILVFDYLVNIESMEFKIRRCCESCGILEKYNTGNLSAQDFVRKSGRLKLKTDPGSGDFLPKNAVKEYLKPEITTASPAPSSEKALIDDDIPF